MHIWEAATNLIRLFVDTGMTYDDIKKKIAGSGGLVAHLGTNDARTVRTMMEQGNEGARLIFEAMAYQEGGIDRVSFDFLILIQFARGHLI